MKKVFTVVYSEDEPGAVQVADSAADALDEFLNRARELKLVFSGQPRVALEGEYLDFDDFSQDYTFVKNPLDSLAVLDGCAFGWVGAEWEIVRNAAPKKVWTLVECEGLWWISPGLHYVNRIGYLLTNENRATGERQYLYD